MPLQFSEKRSYGLILSLSSITSQPRGSLYPEEAQVDGEMGFARGTYTLSITPIAGGDTAYVDGKYLTICKRQADGFWKIYHDCYNSNLPPPQ